MTQQNPTATERQGSSGPVILAGATGDLGMRIARHLVAAGAQVRALVRSQTDQQKIEALQQLGAGIKTVDFTDTAAISAACAGGSCVVSALSGLAEVIIDTQSRLLQGAVQAGVPRFIPSDFCSDYTQLPEGSNRNFDLRRAFSRVLDAAPIKATSIFNGMFTDLLTGTAPVVLFGIKRVLVWGNADQQIDFTTIEDTAAYTAAAALDSTTPRHLRIAGDEVSARDLAQIASKVTGKPFRLLRPGGLKTFGMLIRFTRLVAPQPTEVFPAWQGMQYMHNLYSGLPKFKQLDNDRYPQVTWTPVRTVLQDHVATEKNTAHSS